MLLELASQSGRRGTETEIISQSPNKPLVWKRYIDDIFSLWSTKREEIGSFIELANNYHRRGSRINCDRFLKQRAQRRKLLVRSGEMLPREIFWILTPFSSLSWVSESYRQDIG